MNISASQLSTYKNCPRAYKFSYVDGLKVEPNEFLVEAMRFGTEFHENVVECKSADPLIQKMVAALHKTEFKDYKEKITAKEDSFVVKLEDFNLRAILDANCEEAILEFKSSKNHWPEEKFDNELQPTVYQLAEKIRTGKVKEFIYFIVTKSPYPAVRIWKRKELPKEKINELLLLAQALKNDFEFKPTAYYNNSCGFCPYKDNHCECYF